MILILSVYIEIIKPDLWVKGQMIRFISDNFYILLRNLKNGKTCSMQISRKTELPTHSMIRNFFFLMSYSLSGNTISVYHYILLPHLFLFNFYRFMYMIICVWIDKIILDIYSAVIGVYFKSINILRFRFYTGYIYMRNDKKS